MICETCFESMSPFFLLLKLGIQILVDVIQGRTISYKCYITLYFQVFKLGLQEKLEKVLDVVLELALGGLPAKPLR